MVQLRQCQSTAAGQVCRTVLRIRWQGHAATIGPHQQRIAVKRRSNGGSGEVDEVAAVGRFGVGRQRANADPDHAVLYGQRDLELDGVASVAGDAHRTGGAHGFELVLTTRLNCQDAQPAEVSNRKTMAAAAASSAQSALMIWPSATMDMRMVAALAPAAMASVGSRVRPSPE